MVNKRVLIAGGTTGIGRALAGKLCEKGARVFIFGRNQPELTAALEGLKAAGGECGGTLADVSRTEEVRRAFREAEDKIGSPDIVICGAAVGWSLPLDSEEADWEYVIHTNLCGLIACAREAAVRMKAQRSGHILLFGSMSAEVKEPNGSMYVAAKGGVRALAGSMRKELNPQGISVSLMEPGLTATELHSEGSEKLQPRVEAHEAITAEQVAEAAMFVLTRPAGCEIINLQIRPRLELI